MSKTEVSERVLRGEFLAVGEYRHSRAEMINWRDKQTGRAMSAPVLRHTVEFDSQTIAVSERVPDGTKLEDIHVAFKKGEVVVLLLETMERNLGNVSARGRLERLTGSPGSSTPVGPGQGRS